MYVRCVDIGIGGNIAYAFIVMSLECRSVVF